MSGEHQVLNGWITAVKIYSSGTVKAEVSFERLIDTPWHEEALKLALSRGSAVDLALHLPEGE